MSVAGRARAIPGRFGAQAAAGVVGGTVAEVDHESRPEIPVLVFR